MSACNSQEQLVEQRILQFGTIIDITLIHADRDKAEAALTQIERQLLVYRKNWHAWEDGDLFRFNQALNDTNTATVPESLKKLLALSRQYYHQSQYLFNPALGRLINAYGFHGTSEPDTKTIDLIKADIPTMLDLTLSLTTKQQQAHSSNPHFQLDLGGIAKGFAIGLVADYLTDSGFEHFLINAGGDLYFSGNKFGKPWKIGIQNPFAPGAIAGVELVGDHSLFTSGNYQRYYQKAEKIVHHIIDPRTGDPSNHISSATVLSSDPVLSDVAATTLMIDGIDNHRSLAKSLGIKDYLIISEDKKIIITRSFAQKIEITSDWPVIYID
ncbi:MAG: thiamine biosynthesis lipoprotein [Gammaproteobacteria bacterium]